MLDHVSISHQSGLVLWSKSYTPTFASIAASPASPVSALVREAFIEGKAGVGSSSGSGTGSGAGTGTGDSAAAAFERDGHSVRWVVDNGLGLVFVVVFPALLPLAYIPSLLTRTKDLFVALFHPYLSALLADLSGSAAHALPALRSAILAERWDAIFERSLRSAQSAADARGNRGTGAQTPSTPIHSTLDGAGAGTTLTAEEIAKNVESLKSRMRRKKGSTPTPGASPRRGGAGAGAGGASTPGSATAKLMRKWGDSPVTERDMAALDYSAPAPEGEEAGGAAVNTDGLVSAEAMGRRTEHGYEVAEWSTVATKPLPSEDEILARQTSRLTLGSGPAGAGDGARDGGVGGAAESAWSSVFSRLTGSKTLSMEDLQPVLADMERNLMDKNVAKDIAEKLCEAVGAALVGQKLGTLTSVKHRVNEAISSALTRVLTPKTSTDILLDIKRKRASAAGALSPGAASTPYAMTFVGVNGVGKSTNLSKVCFWLLQNGLRVLIAACDTFRSGAVEQLRVHVRNLGALHSGVELYERGYGKDAAGIAKDAIAYAAEKGFDVVLIDTAGRMQDNEPLMRALAKLVTVNSPDKIIFVGEALVGNEAVDQLTKFDRSLKDFSAVGGARRRGIDGILLTKFDTIDDKVGAALSMTYVTGQPILFVGCGQTYTDLRQLRVGHIVQALLA